MTTDEIRSMLLQKRQIDWPLVGYYAFVAAVILALLWALTIPPG